MKKYKKWLCLLAGIIILIPIIVGIGQYNKDLPSGVSIEGQTFKTNS